MPTMATSVFWGKFGKRPAKRDRRNFAFASLVKKAPKLPDEYDFDEKHVAVPTPMFANDVHGDCVIAARAHQTLRFEWLEQKRVIRISDKDVLGEWRRENHHTEQGLITLLSLRQWRRHGWKVGGRTYKIKAFAEVDRTDHTEIRRAIVMQVGLGIGMMLPYGAIPSFTAGKPWDVMKGHDGKVNPKAGHYVYCPGYTRKGPVCVTWGRKQQMTWAFIDKYCDEAYTVIDAHDEAMKARVGARGAALDYDRLEELLGDVN